MFTPLSFPGWFIDTFGQVQNKKRNVSGFIACYSVPVASMQTFEKFWEYLNFWSLETDGDVSASMFYFAIKTHQCDLHVQFQISA